MKVLKHMKFVEAYKMSITLNLLKYCIPKNIFNVLQRISVIIIIH